MAAARVLLALLTMLLAFPLARSESKIRRTCFGVYKARVDYVNGHPHPNNYVYDVSQHMAATGGCGRTVPNRCRRRARDRIVTCVRTHYTNRKYYASTNTIPRECQIEKYPVKPDLKKMIGTQVCCNVLRKQYRTIAMSLWVQTWGDTGCGSSTTLSLAFDVDCSSLGCGPSTSEAAASWDAEPTSLPESTSVPESTWFVEAIESLKNRLNLAN